MVCQSCQKTDFVRFVAALFHLHDGRVGRCFQPHRRGPIVAAQDPLLPVRPSSDSEAVRLFGRMMKNDGLKLLPKKHLLPK